MAFRWYIVVILPVLIPLFSALLLLLWGRPSTVRRGFVGFVIFSLLCLEGFFIQRNYGGELLFSLIGGWNAPFGIVLVIDLLSSLFLFFCAFILFSSLLYAFSTEEIEEESPLRYPLLFLLLAGVNLSLITGDFFNLFVAFEVMLLSSYGLMTLEADQKQLPHAAIYIVMNLIGSLIFLTAAGFAYGYFGTLNFAHLATFASQEQHIWAFQLLALFSIVIFGLKAALFPLYFWLPTSYPILPTPLAAIYAGILTKVGIYVLIRLFSSVFPEKLVIPEMLLLWISGFTMLLGVLGAVAQNTIKKILSYHIVSQIGFMIFAIGMRSTPAMAAAIFYTLHNVVVKGSLFLVGGCGAYLYGTDELKKMGHLWGLLPFVGFLFLFQALSLAGIPPLSGFFAKYLVLVEGIRTQHTVLVGIAVVTGWLTLFSMMKIWTQAFWGPEKQGVLPVRLPHWSVRGSLILPVLLSLAMGLGAQWMVSFVDKAALQASDREHLMAVLEGGTQ